MKCSYCEKEAVAVLYCYGGGWKHGPYHFCWEHLEERMPYHIRHPYYVDIFSYDEDARKRFKEIISRALMKEANRW